MNDEDDTDRWRNPKRQQSSDDRALASRRDRSFKPRGVPIVKPERHEDSELTSPFDLLEREPDHEVAAVVERSRRDSSDPATFGDVVKLAVALTRERSANATRNAAAEVVLQGPHKAMRASRRAPPSPAPSRSGAGMPRRGTPSPPATPSASRRSSTRSIAWTTSCARSGSCSAGAPSSSSHPRRSDDRPVPVRIPDRPDRRLSRRHRRDLRDSATRSLKGITVSDFTTTMLILGVILGGLGSVLGGLSVVLHAIAPRTKTTADDTAAADIDKVHDKLDALTALLKKLAPPAAVLLVIALAGSSVTACTAARPALAAGVVAALDCEAAHLDAQALADAKLFASAEVQHWLSGAGGAPSSAAIKADLAPIKSDLGRCAIAGALAAAAALVAPAPGTAVSALLAAGPDPAQARVAFQLAARELGWPPVRLAGGTVL